MRTLVLALCTISLLPAAMVTQDISYEFEGTSFSGTATWSDAYAATRPAVLMIPNWMGPTADSLEKAQQLAGERYVVYMADVYGVDVRPTNSDEAGAAAGALRSDRAMLRRRAQAAMDHFLAAEGMPLDTTRTAAIGFCFGGGTVLELARSGSAVDAVVSFHGNLDTPNVEDAKQITAKVLVCHGADDPLVPPEQVAAFKEEMKAPGNIDWQLIEYGGAVHSFTNPQANREGMAMYNATACARAFDSMHDLFIEIWD